MAVTAGCSDGSVPLSEARRHAAAPARPPNLRFPVTPPPSRAASKLPPTSHDDAVAAAREIPVAVALLLAAAAANVATPPTAIAASGGSMGGRSSSSSSSSSSSTSSSSSSWSSSTSSSSSSSGPSWYDSSTTHESVGTAAAPPRAAADVDPAVLVQAWLMLIGLILLAVAVWHYTRPRRTVVKLQVALLGLAKPFQKELNEIAEKVEASNQRWYKFILTETICALNRHNDCCVSSSLSADVKVGADSWEGHFDKISLEERSKFDEETLYNLDGIKRKKEYSKKPDGFSNEYIVVTILVAADGALKFAEIKTPADLVAVLEKLNSIPTREIRGVTVLWTPQEENDILSEERLLADYPNLKPLSDY
ncbi:hypothetical protein CFC21_105292 [Triticum aestivum]|uniref:Uncharacterized protein n=2 Tax=Triticum aestivum TaxID=4565 RepID=A0A9R1MBU5_WHEAT|nr:uncharacterized protein LOC123162617 [Triticum aestivum]KAF7104390.1 hypothetical protein CFC21_105290 [Triticum aestivum]KAF7104392.1 hypothetical protein CFC21_105292 [Triticum aestivum]